MEDIIRVLAIDGDEKRVRQISRCLAEYDPGIKIEHPGDAESLIQLMETNSFDCIITPEDLSFLNRTELLQRLAEVLSLPVIRYLGESRLPESTRLDSSLIQELLSRENKLSYRVLSKRIRRTIASNGEMRFAGLGLPDAPRVMVRGDRLFIVDENGSERLWGCESMDEIHDIARDMELELRAVRWVRLELERLIGELTEVVMYSGVPEDRVSDIIFEGYRSLLALFMRMDEYYGKR
ncbi:hypothetical protein GF326_11105 [Candidatus Bathyarchaeota archaeon]|nr:hypothetical protein [Candidatus Bathyarchaeota archaeon]